MHEESEEQVKFAAEIREVGATLVNLSYTESNSSPIAPKHIPSQGESSPEVAIFWHPACELHDIPNHPEQPKRVSSILSALHTEFDGILPFIEAPRVTREQIALFHTEKMINRFEAMCARVIIKQEKLNDGTYKGKQDIVYNKDIDGGDTVIMHTTQEAAYRAAGAMIAAIDGLYTSPSPLHHAVFCCVRPPGHHAEPAKAMGFCFLNNAGIGARYAWSAKYAARIALLDFDVHHGNGVEEGCKLWHNESESDKCYLFYGSTHEQGNYPGTGPDPSPYVGKLAKQPIHRRIVNRYLKATEDTAFSSKQFQAKWTEILQEMIVFAPELIIISAGFDAHLDDPLGGLALMEEDYYWATQAIFLAGIEIGLYKRQAANGKHQAASSSSATTTASATEQIQLPQGLQQQLDLPKVVSILEGGYDLSAISKSAVRHVQSLREGYHALDPDVVEQIMVKCQQQQRQEEEIGKDEEEQEEGGRYGGNEVKALQETLKEMGL